MTKTRFSIRFLEGNLFTITKPKPSLNPCIFLYICRKKNPRASSQSVHKGSIRHHHLFLLLPYSTLPWNRLYVVQLELRGKEIQVYMRCHSHMWCHMPDTSYHVPGTYYYLSFITSYLTGDGTQEQSSRMQGTWSWEAVSPLLYMYSDCYYCICIWLKEYGITIYLS
jgi:hypothetical protein